MMKLELNVSTLQHLLMPQQNSNAYICKSCTLHFALCWKAYVIISVVTVVIFPFFLITHAEQT